MLSIKSKLQLWKIIWISNKIFADMCSMKNFVISAQVEEPDCLYPIYRIS
jgi:hypothetical protein